MKYALLISLLLASCVTRSDRLGGLYDQQILLTKQRGAEDRAALERLLTEASKLPDDVAVAAATRALVEFDRDLQMEVLKIEVAKERDIHAINQQEAQDFHNLSMSVNGLTNTMQNIDQQNKIKDLQVEQQRLRQQQDLDRSH